MAKNIDFVGFTFNGRHSSEFNIYSVSDGSRYQDNLVPSPIDYTEQIPGGVGQYYFGSDIDIQNFPLSIAYDNLSELQLRELRQWLSPSIVGELIFDEEPYKTYTAKISDSPSLTYICFDRSSSNEVSNKRVYKGEGSINFVCYYPLARVSGESIPNSFDEVPLKIPIKVNVEVSGYTEDPSDQGIWEWVSALCTSIGDSSCECTFNYLGQSRTATIDALANIRINKKELQYYSFFKDKYTNVDEWAEASGLLENLNTTGVNAGYDHDITLPDGTGAKGIQLYNPGDKETDFILSFNKPDTLSRITFRLNSGESFTLSLRSEDTEEERDKYGAVSEEEIQVAAMKGGTITIDTKKNRIMYRKQDLSTSQVFETSIYFALKEGRFFKIPINRNSNGGYSITIDTADNLERESIRIDYDYLYY